MDADQREKEKDQTVSSTDHNGQGSYPQHLSAWLSIHTARQKSKEEQKKNSEMD